MGGCAEGDDAALLEVDDFFTRVVVAEFSGAYFGSACVQEDSAEILACGEAFWEGGTMSTLAHIQIFTPQLYFFYGRMTKI